MSDLPKEVALKILALVDEYPSEPFSFERREVEDRLVEILCTYAGQAEDELDMSYQLGYEEGQSQTEQEHEDTIQDLEDNINDLETEVSDLRAYIQTLETDN